MFVVGAGQDDGELVAAEPGDQITGADVGADAGGDGFQDGVAGFVAEGVVDGFEAVESRLT